MAKPKTLEQLRAETQLAQEQHKPSVWGSERSLRMLSIIDILPFFPV